MSKKPQRHIVILGGLAYQETRPLPEKEPGMEFWAQNAVEQAIHPKTSYDTGTDNVAMLAEVVDRWYEIHKPELTAELHPKHVGWLWHEYGGAIVVQDMAAWITSHATPGPLRPYPIDEVQALTPHGNYLAGTFSYMVAHAILEGVDKISFHWMAKGVVRSPREPRDAQANLEYWLGVAEGRGIEVDPGDLWLLRTWWDGRYGFDGMPPEWHSDRADKQYREYLMEGLADYYEAEKTD